MFSHSSSVMLCSGAREERQVHTTYMHLIAESYPFLKHECFLGILLVHANVEDNNIVAMDIIAMVPGHA